MQPLLTNDRDVRHLIVFGRAGDHAAIEALYQRYGQDVLDVAFRLTSNVDEAEDIAQDVFIGLPEALAHYHEQGTFVAWIRRVTARTALMRMRCDRRARARHEQQAPVRGRRDHPADRIAERLTVETAFAALTKEQRVVVVLRLVEGYSHKEIASLIGVRIGTVEVRFHRAIKKLRALLREDL